MMMVFVSSVNELLKAKEDLTVERDAKLQEITSLREKLSETQESEQKLEKERDEAQCTLNEVGFHSVIFFTFPLLPPEALSTVLRSHVVCPSICNIGGSGAHMLEILETDCTDIISLTPSLFVALLQREHGEILGRLKSYKEDPVELDCIV